MKLTPQSLQGALHDYTKWLTSTRPFRRFLMLMPALLLSWSSPAATLGDALDNTNVVWTTSGDVSWVVHTNVTHDGTDSATSGTITHSQSSTLETSVTGPGIVTFWWRVSSEVNQDVVVFYVGGVEQARLSGESGWQPYRAAVPAGTHALTWLYEKNNDGGWGNDRAWVDQVQYAPTVEPVIVLQPQSMSTSAWSTVSLRVKAAGQEPLAYQWFFNLTNALPNATNATLLFAPLHVEDAGLYHVVVTNVFGAATSEVASVTIVPYLTLAEALDATNLTWTTEAERGLTWRGQTQWSQDGSDAAIAQLYTGLAGVHGSATLETTVVGPGVVTFWWKISAEDHDLLQFIMGGAEKTRLTGDVEWQPCAWAVPAGAHTLQWKLSREYYDNRWHRAWLDQVQFTNVSAVTIAPQPASLRVVLGSAVFFTAFATGAEPLAWQWYFNVTNALPNATNATLVIPSSTLADAGCYHAVVSGGGNSATSQVATLEVLSPTSITKLGQVDFPTWTQSSGLDVVGNWVVTATWNGNDPYAGGMGIYDVSNPATPQLLSEIDIGLTSHEVDVVVRGHLAYVFEGHGLGMIDISDPNHPVGRGFMNVASIAGSVERFDDRYAQMCFASAAGESFVQFVNLATPALAGRFGFVGTTPRDAVAATPNLALVVGGAYGTTTREGWLQILDFTDPAMPTWLGGFTEMSCEAYAVECANGFAFVANTYQGLRIMDVSSPAAPRSVATYSLGNNHNVMDVKLAGHLACLATTAGMKILDVSDVLHPVLVGEYAPSNAPVFMGLELAGNHVFLRPDNRGFHIVQADAIPPAGPVISFQPLGTNIWPGQKALLSVNARGNLPLSFQWLKDGTNVLESGRIAGSQSLWLRVTNAEIGDTGDYQLVLTNTYGAVTSQVARLSVLAKPTIKDQPDSLYVLPGSNATFTVITEGEPPPAYQWRFGVKPMLGQTNATLVVTDVQLADLGEYRVVASNVAGSVTSQVATLSFGASCVITGQPQSQWVARGSNALFTVGAGGIPTPNYQWLFGGSPLPGETGASLLLTQVQDAHAGEYSVLVSNYVSELLSQNATLMVGLPPAITQQPQDVWAMPQSNATFTAAISGEPAPALQWYHNGTTLLAGETNATLVLENVDYAQQGGYHISARNPLGTLTSRTALLNIGAPTTILQQPQNQWVMRHSNAVFNVVAYGEPPPAMQWYFNDLTPLAGATNATLLLTDVMPPQEGTYRVRLTNIHGTLWSASARLTLLQREATSLWPGVDPADVRAVQVVGPYAYVADFNGSLGIYDVSHPACPMPLAGLNTAGTPLDVCVAGDRAYVADGVDGLLIFDISAPWSPKLLGSFDTGSAYGVCVVSNLAYVADWNWGLRIVDVSVPTNAVLVGGYDTGGEGRDVAVVGSLAYVVDRTSGLIILNISQPTNITLVGSYDLTVEPQSVTVENNRAFVAWGTSGLQILSVSDPAHPSLISSNDTTSTSYAVATVGNRAWLSEGSTLRTLDLSSPTNVVRTGALTTSGIIYGLQVNGALAYAANGRAGLCVYDVSGTNAVPTGAYDPDVKMLCVQVAGGFAYAGCVPGGLQIVDARNPFMPRPVTVYRPDLSVWGVQVVSQKAYLAAGHDLVHIVDVSNPAAPAPLGQWGSTYQDYADVWVVGTHAFVADRQGRLHIVDVSNPTAPLTVTNVSVGSYVNAVCVQGNFAYLAADSGGLKIYDVSDPVQPTLVGAVTLGDTAEDVQVVGDVAYLACRLNGLKIVDVSQPSNPVVQATYDPGTVWGVSVMDNLAFLACDSGGMHVVDVNDPANPWAVWEYDSVGVGKAVHVTPTVAALADYHLGLAFFTLNSISPPPRLTIALDATECRVTVGDLTGHGDLILETSTNLTDWQPWQTNMIVGGESTFPLPLPNDPPTTRFFRAVRP